MYLRVSSIELNTVNKLWLTNSSTVRLVLSVWSKGKHRHRLLVELTPQTKQANAIHVHRRMRQLRRQNLADRESFNDWHTSIQSNSQTSTKERLALWTTPYNTCTHTLFSLHRMCRDATRPIYIPEQNNINTNRVTQNARTDATRPSQCRTRLRWYGQSYVSSRRVCIYV